MIRTALLLIASLAATPVAVRDIDGTPLSLLSPSGRQLDLLFFISSDCPISNRYAPEIQRVCSDYQSRGVRCVAVYPDAPDVATVKRHRQEYGFAAAIPAVIDRDRALVRAVGPRVTPEAAIYSSNGRLYRGRIDDWYVDVGRARRAPTHQDLRLALDAALAGKPISPSETEAVGCFIPQS
jgi:AhpC/TSA family